MRLPPRRVRRLLLPVEVAVVVVLGAGWALAAAVGVLAAPFTRRRRLLRVASLAVAYCGMELVALAAAGGLWLRRPRVGRWRVGSEAAWAASNQALLAAALSWVLAAARRCTGFTVTMADAPEPEELAGAGPVLVLARHAGPGDSFALVHLLLTRYRRRVRVVVKDVLQLDPALDVLLNRLGACFLTAGGDDLADDLAAAARLVGPSEVLLVFPEGGNWTPNRRRRAIRRLRAAGREDAARAAVLMTHVLPARPGGVLAALAARPDLAVVIVAHAGLDHLAGAGPAWAALPFAEAMTVRAWASAPVPAGDEARRDWLAAEWAVVDEWVDAERARP